MKLLLHESTNKKENTFTNFRVFVSVILAQES